MNIFTRLSDLSFDDLHELQATILSEIQRREELAGIGAKKPGKGQLSVPMSKPAPAAARPAAPRRRAA